MGPVVWVDRRPQLLGRQATSGGNFGRRRHYLWGVLWSLHQASCSIKRPGLNLWGVVWVIGRVINFSLLSDRRPTSWAIEFTLSKDSGRYKNVRIAVNWQSQEGSHCQFSGFLFIPFPVIFLYKKFATYFFSVKLKWSLLDCCHLTTFFQHVLDYCFFMGLNPIFS